MSDKGIRLEEAGRVARVVMDRPKVNAMSTGMYQELIDIFTALNARDDIDVVVLESSNPAIFCAGADIRELQGIVNSDGDALDVRRQVLARTVYDLLLNLTQPTVAAVGGIAFGAGAVLAACCDIRVGSSTTRIGLTEVNVARCGGARHLARIVPESVVRRMYFTAEPLGLDDLVRHGAVTDVAEPGREPELANEIAARIATKSPIALRIAKQALNASEPLSIADGYVLEQEYTVKLGRTDDAKEATAAFMEKRDPVWTGR